MLETFTAQPFDPDYPNDPYYENDLDFAKLFIDSLLEPVTNLPEGEISRDLSTRENYVDNIQSELAYFISLYLSLPDNVTAALKDKLSKMGTLEMLSLLSVDGLYNFIAPVLDEYSFAYDEEVLRPASNAIVGLAQQKLKVLLLLAGEPTKANLLRLVHFHTLEAVLPLLLAL